MVLALLLAEDRDLVRASSLLQSILAEDKGNIPALRTLEHTLSRTDQFAELAGVLRCSADVRNSGGAPRRGGAAHRLEEHRGIPAKNGAPLAAELLRSLAPDDILMHETVLKRSLSGASGAAAAMVTSSLGVLASHTTDAHHAAALQLAGLCSWRGNALDHESSIFATMLFGATAWCSTAGQSASSRREA